ncbi:DUF2306 domain-containing protein [Stenotrophomonas rhizophila]|uniref:DUF2306 domain-containing protein n=1 Tax=Stenotrophomonas rhizophila TaxID=216778 RepID=UPI001E340480|nr:DUF2306 domain-containing protein [Stenotrophomonas rhizophila]MCC7633479.1 DUF2306 domain-containing protein [Stenotrophomonas rhizophila]MCC7663036.1 DUF2306 domain-containing protein [Stenotrophomonas rhizophila]
MATRGNSAARLWTRLGWGLVWCLALGMGAEFLLETYRKYSVLDSQAYQMFLLRRGWLWTHLAGGTITVVLGLLQFLPRLRQRHPGVHRWVGRVYLLGMLVACTGVVALLLTSPAPAQILMGFAITALAWLASALAGLVAIGKGRVAVHRRWMIRNYLVTLAPVLFRLALPLALWLGVVPSPQVIGVLLVAAWMAPWLVYEACRHAAGWLGIAAPAR